MRQLPVGVIVMLEALWGAGFILLVLGVAAVLKSRHDDKCAADRILEQRGHKVTDIYCPSLDDLQIPARNRSENVRPHLVAKDGNLLSASEKVRKVS